MLSVALVCGFCGPVYSLVTAATVYSFTWIFELFYSWSYVGIFCLLMW